MTFCVRGDSLGERLDAPKVRTMSEAGEPDIPDGIDPLTDSERDTETKSEVSTYSSPSLLSEPEKDLPTESAELAGTISGMPEISEVLPEEEEEEEEESPIANNEEAAEDNGKEVEESDNVPTDHVGSDGHANGTSHFTAAGDELPPRSLPRSVSHKILGSQGSMEKDQEEGVGRSKENHASRRWTMVKQAVVEDRPKVLDTLQSLPDHPNLADCAQFIISTTPEDQLAESHIGTNRWKEVLQHRRNKSLLSNQRELDQLIAVRCAQDINKEALNLEIVNGERKLNSANRWKRGTMKLKGPIDIDAMAGENISHSGTTGDATSAVGRATQDLLATQGKLTPELRLQGAARFIRDSLAGRAAIVQAGRFRRAVYAVHSHNLYAILMGLIIFVYLGLVFFERPSNRSHPPFPTLTPFVIFLQYAIMGVFAGDLLLKFIAIGQREFVRGGWNWVTIALILVVIIDLTASIAFDYYCSSCAYIQFSRPFRPVFAIARLRRIREIITTTLKTIPNLVEVASLFMLWLFMFAVAGVILFRGDYNIWGGDGEFDNFLSSYLAIFVLSTSENYPSIMWPALNKSPLYAFFFIIFIAVAIYVLLSVVVALIFQSYQSARKKQQLQEKIESRKVLAGAFKFLDADKDNFISFSLWTDLLKLLKPNLDPEYARKTFLDINLGEDDIDMMEFFQLCDSLLDEVEEIVDLSRSTQLLQRFQYYTTWLMDSPAYRFALWLVLLVDSIAYACILSTSAPTISWTYYYSVTVTLTYYIYCIYATNMVCALIMLSDQIFRIAGLGPKSFFIRRWNQFDFTTTIISVVSIFIASTLFLFGFPYEEPIRIFHAISVILLMRVISCSAKLRRLAEIVNHMFGIMSLVVVMLLLLMYTYAIAGMELFDGYHPTDYVNYYHTFDNFGGTMLTLFQLLTTSNWHDVMYAYMTTYGSSYFFKAIIALFFVSFIVIVVIVILGLVIALIIEQFEYYYEHKGEEEFLLEMTEHDEAVEEQQRKEPGHHRSRKFRRKRANTESIMEGDEYNELSNILGMNFQEMKRKRDMQILEKKQSESQMQLLSDDVTQDQPPKSLTRSGSGRTRRPSVAPSPVTISQSSPVRARAALHKREKSHSDTGNDGSVTARNGHRRSETGTSTQITALSKGSDHSGSSRDLPSSLTKTKESTSDGHSPELTAVAWKHSAWSGVNVLSAQEAAIFEMTELELDRRTRQRQRMAKNTRHLRKHLPK